MTARHGIRVTDQRTNRVARRLAMAPSTGCTRTDRPENADSLDIPGRIAIFAGIIEACRLADVDPGVARFRTRM